MVNLLEDIKNSGEKKQNLSNVKALKLKEKTAIQKDSEKAVHEKAIKNLNELGLSIKEKKDAMDFFEYQFDPILQQYKDKKDPRLYLSEGSRKNATNETINSGRAEIAQEIIDLKILPEIRKEENIKANNEVFSYEDEKTGKTVYNNEEAQRRIREITDGGFRKEFVHERTDENGKTELYIDFIGLFYKTNNAFIEIDDSKDLSKKEKQTKKDDILNEEVRRLIKITGKKDKEIRAFIEKTSEESQFILLRNALKNNPDTYKKIIDENYKPNYDTAFRSLSGRFKKKEKNGQAIDISTKIIIY